MHYFEILSTDVHEEPIFLVLAGGIGWKSDKLIELINNSPYRNRIVLTGYVSVEEKVQLYRLCKAFVFPSHYEGFGTPIIEAQSQGAMVISANNSSLVEVGGDSVAYVKNENDVFELEQIMEYVLSKNKEDIAETKKTRIRKHQKIFLGEYCKKKIKKEFEKIEV